MIRTLKHAFETDPGQGQSRESFLKKAADYRSNIFGRIPFEPMQPFTKAELVILQFTQPK